MNGVGGLTLGFKSQFDAQNLDGPFDASVVKFDLARYPFRSPIPIFERQCASRTSIKRGLSSKTTQFKISSCVTLKNYGPQTND